MISDLTFKFLTEVASNNERDWFEENKSRYEESNKNVLEFTAKLISELAKFDPALSTDISPKNCLMRIYRDVRFSKDKSPYKTNFGVGISPEGKNFNGPGYYIHIEPLRSFVAAGSWFPPADYLKSIRQEIDYNGSIWHEILDNPDFKNTFGDLDVEGKLQTSPKGYDSGHPDIEYLKLKSFTASCPLSNTQLSAPNAASFVAELFKKLYPFIIFLRNANS